VPTSASRGTLGEIMENKMSVSYELINGTKQERISFIHLPACTKNELVGCDISASLTTLYMLENIGDNIYFLSDQNNREINSYPDVTFEYIKILLDKKIYRDEGFLYVDEDESKSVYIKKYRNIWYEDSP
jgi:hypothetical protein